MAIGGDYDNMYRRFLSAQGRRLAKAETMLRKTMHWRSTDLEEDASMEVHTSGAEECDV